MNERGKKVLDTTCSHCFQLPYIRLPCLNGPIVARSLLLFHSFTNHHIPLYVYLNLPLIIIIILTYLVHICHSSLYYREQINLILFFSFILYIYYIPLCFAFFLRSYTSDLFSLIIGSMSILCICLRSFWCQFGHVLSINNFFLHSFNSKDV